MKKFKKNIQATAGSLLFLQTKPVDKDPNSKFESVEGLLKAKENDIYRYQKVTNEHPMQGEVVASTIEGISPGDIVYLKVHYRDDPYLVEGEVLHRAWIQEIGVVIKP